MIGEEKNETLPNGASSTEDTNVDLASFREMMHGDEDEAKDDGGDKRLRLDLERREESGGETSLPGARDRPAARTALALRPRRRRRPRPRSQRQTVRRRQIQQNVGNCYH